MVMAIFAIVLDNEPSGPGGAAVSVAPCLLFALDIELLEEGTRSC